MQDINIGEKVQTFRLQKNLSLRQLASEAGTTPSMLSQIENNLVNPSINTLKDIARVLGVPMFKFFKNDSDPESLIVRKGQYKIIGNPGEDVYYQLLTPDTNGDIEFCLMEFPPHSSSSEIPHEHEGDSIRIPALNAHRWINNTNETVKVIFAVTPPGF